MALPTAGLEQIETSGDRKNVCQTLNLKVRQFISRHIILLNNCVVQNSNGSRRLNCDPPFGPKECLLPSRPVWGWRNHDMASLHAGYCWLSILHPWVSQSLLFYLFFYSSQRELDSNIKNRGRALRLVSCLELVPGNVLSDFRGLPNAFLSSDHQALVARFDSS